MKKTEISDYLAVDEVFAKAITDLIKVHNSQLIASLGEPAQDNEYILKPDESGRWWLTHKHVGSGEPFEQFLNE
jgi:hypothetical protein